MMEIYRNRQVPELRFRVTQIVRRNNVFVARGVILNDGTRTAITTQKLASEWEVEK